MDLRGLRAATPDLLLKTTVGKITSLVGGAFSEDSAVSGTALIGVYVSFDSLVNYRSDQHISGVDQQHDSNMIPPYKRPLSMHISFVNCFIF